MNGRLRGGSGGGSHFYILLGVQQNVIHVIYLIGRGRLGSVDVGVEISIQGSWLAGSQVLFTF